MSPSPVYDDHDYVCCRSSKVATASKDQNRRANVQPEGGSPQSRTGSREVNTFVKVGHDARRKLCIVGFNWKSSQLRLNKLGAEKSGTAGDGRIKTKEKSSRSKVVLAPGESTDVRTTIQTASGASGDRSEVVQNAGQQTGSGAKRRSKVYIYKPARSAAATAGARSTTAKPVALVNKSERGKTRPGNTLMSSVDETSAAVESIIPTSADLHTTTDVSAPVGGLHTRAGEYTIHLSSTGSSKPPESSAKQPSPNYGYLSSLLRETGSGIPPSCEMMSAAAMSLQQIIEGGVQTPSSLSTAPLGIPSPFLLQTGLEQALGFAAFHPMSPSTSSSSCSRVAGDDCPMNDDNDLTGPHTARLDSDAVVRSTFLPPEDWIGGSVYTHGHYDKSRITEARGSGDAAAFYSPTSQAETVFFDDVSVPYSNDGDLRYESSSCDGYQREEQVDNCLSQPPFHFPFGRKSATSRLRFTDAGIITTFGGGGSSFGRAGARGDRRRKQPEDKRNRKFLNDAEGDVVTMPATDGSDAISASKKSCRQRKYGDGTRRSLPSTDITHIESEVLVDVDNLDRAQKNSSNRRRKQPPSVRKKYAAAVENLRSVTSDGTPKVEVVSKKKPQSRSCRRQLESSRETQASAVR